MVSELFYTSEHLVSPQKKDTGKRKLGSLIQKSRETAARTGPNRMVGAFHPTNDECEGQNRSAMLHAALHNTGMLPSYKQTLHAWLLKTLPPTVQTPCKHSIAFPNASLAVTRASDANIMLPAPSDHHMRETTTTLLSVSATLDPQLVMIVEVLRALSGPARRNA